MENSDHVNQIRETSGIALVFENKGIVSEVDWKSKVGCLFVNSSQVVLNANRRFECKSSTLSRFWDNFGTALGRIGKPPLPRVLE